MFMKPWPDTKRMSLTTNSSSFQINQRTDVFAIGMTCLELGTKPKLQHVYDHSMKSCRRERIETLASQFFYNCDEKNPLRQAIYKMLEFEENKRYSCTQLLKKLPAKATILEHLRQQEGNKDIGVQSHDPSRGFSPNSNKIVMNSSVKAPQSFLHEGDTDIPAAMTYDMTTTNKWGGGSSLSNYYSRKSAGDGFSGIEVHLKEYQKKKRQEQKDIEAAKIHTPHTNNKPLRSTFMGKHDWYQKDNEGATIYRDYMAPVHSVNRIVRGQPELLPGQIRTHDGRVVHGQDESPEEALRRAIFKQKEIMDNFNQPEIKKNLERDFETNLSYIRTQNQPQQDLSETGFNLYEKPYEAPDTKYYQDYFFLPNGEKPRFYSVTPGQDHLGRPEVKKKAIDPAVVNNMGKYSDVTAIYHLGAEDESEDLIELQRQLG